MTYVLHNLDRNEEAVQCCNLQKLTVDAHTGFELVEYEPILLKVPSLVIRQSGDAELDHISVGDDELAVVRNAKPVRVSERQHRERDVRDNGKHRQSQRDSVRDVPNLAVKLEQKVIERFSLILASGVLRPQIREQPEYEVEHEAQVDREKHDTHSARGSVAACPYIHGEDLALRGDFKAARRQQAEHDLVVDEHVKVPIVMDEIEDHRRGVFCEETFIHKPFEHEMGLHRG
mmetsp:Transcript_35827/g.98719  ORF Transcript_35827/g.98719 Transcript_35827/m.98719 type:complete len:232 (-) Transcript_35827:3025-3720(-)